MIEVFKTNVTSYQQAKGLLEAFHQTFPAWLANFDLDDCDRVLRVVPKEAPVHAEAVLHLLQAHGIKAEPLPDEPPSFSRLALLEAVSPN
jgi:hypothetical protein